MAAGNVNVVICDAVANTISGALATIRTNFGVSGVYLMSNLDKQIVVAGIQNIV